MATDMEMTMQASFFVENKSTVRDTAIAFKTSKSTVHVNLTKRLKDVNPNLYKRVRKILDTNKDERHIRGGLATKAKYENKKT